MALMTTAECKTLLRITDSTYDDDIDTFLPLVEDDLIEELRDAFQDGYVYRESLADLEFVQGDSDTHDYITDAGGKFVERGFADDMDIVIEGGYSNVGLYTIDSASTDKLVLSEYGELVPQDQDGSADDHNIGMVRISRVKWPNAIKPIAAQMVWHRIQDAKPSDVQSESLDDYSITYVGSYAYPVKVGKALNKYRKVRLR